MTSSPQRCIERCESLDGRCRAYTQSFDDGSLLTVTDTFEADGSTDESWTFDDATTEQPVDQEGSVHYAADGTGEGTVTTHVVGGEPETCQIHIDAGGNTSVDNCASGTL